MIRLKSATPRRDYINVLDVAEAIVTCSRSEETYGVYNACSGVSVSVREITEIIKRNLKHEVKFEFSISDRPHEVDESLGSCERIKSLGWAPRVSFEEGIRQILKSENL